MQITMGDLTNRFLPRDQLEILERRRADFQAQEAALRAQEAALEAEEAALRGQEAALRAQQTALRAVLRAQEAALQAQQTLQLPTQVQNARSLRARVATCGRQL